MNLLNTRLVALYVGLALAGATGTALAQSKRGPDRRMEMQSDSVFSLGLGAAISPEYLGAKDSRVQPVPMVYIKQGPFYLDSLRGLGYRYDTDSGLFFGQALNWDPGRADHKSDSRPGANRLRGMGTIKGALVTSAEVGYSFAPWLAVRAEGEFALTERDRGNRYTLGLEGGLYSGSKNEVWYSVNAHFSDRRFARTYFGVSPSQNAATSFARYTPDRGLYAYSASLNWEHRFTKHWSVLFSVNAVNLVGDAEKSPIVQERLNSFVLGAINYTF